MKIGFWELVVIVIVAFVFIGPDQLPVYAKKIGKMLRELKKYTGAASEEIQKNVVEPLNEIQAPLKEAVAPLTDIKKDIDNSVKDVTKSFTGIGKTSKEEAAKAEAAEEVALFCSVPFILPFFLPAQAVRERDKSTNMHTNKNGLIFFIKHSPFVYLLLVCNIRECFIVLNFSRQNLQLHYVTHVV